jgi:hypothetical protein
MLDLLWKRYGNSILGEHSRRAIKGGYFEPQTATSWTAALYQGTASEAAEKRLKQVNSAFCATTIQ